jgi:hypothetical protein
MNINEAHQVMNALATTTLAALSPVPSIVYDNVSEPESDTEYAELRFNHIVDVQATFGSATNRRFERRELLTVRYYAQRDFGTSTTDDAIQALRTAFEGFKSGELWVVNLTPRFVRFNGKHRVTDVDVLYYYHEKK